MDNENSFSLEIVTPHGTIVDAKVTYVSAPGVEGEFGVLAGHTEFLTTLNPGEIKYEDDKGEHLLAVSWGYAEVRSRSVIILADSAESADTIDIKRAEENLQKYGKELESLTPDDESYKLFEAKTLKAKARIEVYNKQAS